MSDEQGAALIQRLTPLLSRVRRDVSWSMPPGNPPSRTDNQINKARMLRHLSGAPYCGAAFILPGESTTRVGLLDLDSHKGATPWGEMQDTAARICDELTRRRLAPVAFRSTGGSGIHIYLLWQEPQDAYSVRQLLASALQSVGLRPGTKGVADGQVEVFPKQDSVPVGGYGNMAILPLAGASRWLDPVLDYCVTDLDTPFDWPLSCDVPVLERPERELVAVEPSVELESFRRALDAIPNSGAQELDYDQWRNVVFSIHHATGGSDEGLALAQDFSARSGKCDLDFLNDRVWPYIQDERDGGITDRYVLAMAGEHGWIDASPDDFDAVPPPADDFETVEAPAPETKESRFRVKSVEEFTSAPPPRWLIKGVLPEAEVVVLYGASASGKSFLALDMAAALDRGLPWRGDHRTRKARVAYVCAEGAGGFRSRIRAYQQEHQCRLEIGVIEVAPNFLDRDEVLEVAREIVAWGRADLVILDTWAQVLPGANENSGEDIGKALGHCKGLRRATGATVMLVHHSGKDESRGARGWSGLRAAADAELEVIREGENRAVTITKMKDGEDGASYGFSLLTGVHTGMLDEDGEPITSCIVSHNSMEAADVRNSKPERLTAAEDHLLQTLHASLIGVGGGLAHAVLLADALASAEPGKKGLSRGALSRALATLINKGLVTEERGFLHPVADPE